MNVCSEETRSLTCLKSLRAVAVLLSDLRENMKHVKGARRPLADIAARDHAHMIRAYRCYM